jgi:hypothetical protein
MSITSVETIQATPLSKLPIDWEAISPEQIEVLVEQLQLTHDQYEKLEAERQRVIEEMKKQHVNTDTDGAPPSGDIPEQRTRDKED